VDGAHVDAAVRDAARVLEAAHDVYLDDVDATIRC
jgi:hypothetical protein